MRQLRRMPEKHKEREACAPCAPRPPLRSPDSRGPRGNYARSPMPDRRTCLRTTCCTSAHRCVVREHARHMGTLGAVVTKWQRSLATAGVFPVHAKHPSAHMRCDQISDIHL